MGYHLEGCMKKFSQIDITESTDKDFAHFKKHAAAYIKHANRAAKYDEDYDRRDDAGPEWEKSEHHGNEIQKYHGEKVQDHMHNNLSGHSAEEIKHVWDTRPKN